jgi:hypothetical protein
MKKSFIYHGVTFSAGDDITCIIKGKKVLKAKIQEVKDTFYICQNVADPEDDDYCSDNKDCPNKFGFDYSWGIQRGEPDGNYVMQLKNKSTKVISTDNPEYILAYQLVDVGDPIVICKTLKDVEDIINHFASNSEEHAYEDDSGQEIDENSFMVYKVVKEMNVAIERKITIS